MRHEDRGRVSDDCWVSFLGPIADICGFFLVSQYLLPPCFGSITVILSEEKNDLSIPLCVDLVILSIKEEACPSLRRSRLITKPRPLESLF